PDGSLWFGTYGGGVSRFDEGLWKTYTTQDGLAHNTVFAIVATPDGAIWFGTWGGLSRFDGVSWTTYTPENSPLPDYDIRSLAVGPGNLLWIGTNHGGVLSFDGRSWHHYTPADGLATNGVFAITIDSSGDLWFGTYGGISHFVPSR
ncbi:MAG: two-component regulator propeller domain-containing protein, partial [Chloroflexota bacterium]|nr:two-component regulator propeller domain-containing protein [Chloroflexota bacterium]